VTLSRKLLRIFALSLGLDEGYFDKFVTYSGCMSRILHYPPQPVPGEERVGIEAHTVRPSLLLSRRGIMVRKEVLISEGLRMLHNPLPRLRPSAASPQLE
jgi:hypothetical protein